MQTLNIVDNIHIITRIDFAYVKVNLTNTTNKTISKYIKPLYLNDVVLTYPYIYIYIINNTLYQTAKASNTFTPRAKNKTNMNQTTARFSVYL